MKLRLFRFQDSGVNSSSSSNAVIPANRTFKLGLGLSKTEALVAVNGQQVARFNLNRNEDFSAIRALEVLKEVKLAMEVTGVDFLKVSEADLPLFPSFTKI
jgi:hypothetical protein